MSELTVPRPRNDFVVIKREIVDTVNGIAVPSNTLNGQRFKVVHVGPKVDDLHGGEYVLITGVHGEDWNFIPNIKDHLVIREGNVIVVFEEESSCFPPECDGTAQDVEGDFVPVIAQDGFCKCGDGDPCPLKKKESCCSHHELRNAGIAFSYEELPDDNYCDNPQGVV